MCSSDLASGSEPPLWKIRLYPLYLLGQERALRVRLRGGGACPDIGQDPEPGLCEKNIRDRDRDADGIRGIRQQAGMPGGGLEESNIESFKIAVL